MATFDARPIIAAGDEPFDQIMAAVAALEDGEELIILALGSQGFSYEALELAPDDWRVSFRRQP
jgi:hypothetical protein